MDNVKSDHLYPMIPVKTQASHSQGVTALGLKIILMTQIF